MVRRAAIVTMASAVLVMPAAGQSGGAEHGRLAPMVGRWQTEVEFKASSTAPASKMTGAEECAWFTNLHVVCRNEAKGETGPYTSIRLISYYPALKQYAAYTVDSRGGVHLALGQISGDTWTFSSETGESKSRLVITMTPTGYTGTNEVSSGKGPWTQVSSIKATRTEP